MPKITAREMTRIIRRLETIYVKLDGSLASGNKSISDEFFNLQMSISKQVLQVRTKFQRIKNLEVKTDAFIERLKLKNEVKAILEEIERKFDIIRRVGDSQEKSKSITQRAKEDRRQIIDKLEQIYTKVKALIDPKDITEDEEDCPKRTVLKLADLKQGKHQNNDRFASEDDEQDSALLKEWKTWDTQVDDKLDDINLLLGEMTDMNENLKHEIDIRNNMVGETNKDVAKVNDVLEQQNKDLFEVLQRFREPSKLCMDCCLCVFFIGLLCVIYSLLKNGR